MNESVNVSNYGIFNDAIGDVNNLNTGIGNAETAIATCQKQLANESIFMGPIADNCKEELEKVAKEQISAMRESANSTKNFLSSTNSNYQNTDDQVKKAISLAGSTTLGNTQASSFYELGDRAYEGDSAAQQEWIEKVAKIVDSSQYSKYGLKNSLLIAQIINESGWMHTPQKTNDDGSTLSGNNNVLGINTDMGKPIEEQDSAWSKKRKSTQSNVMQWDENGNVIGTSEAMRTYDSVEECIEDYANVLYLYHPECKGSNNLEDYRSFLEGYTPNPNQSTTDHYADIIAKYGLEKYDR